MRDGTWSWPTDITISLGTFDFLNKTMQHDPLHRPTWREMKEHQIFTDTENLNNRIPLDIVFDEEPEDGISFSEGKIYMNTNEPARYANLYN
mmetsp:Transcript_41388/g.54456  ORF Transcript_41388/g.54456 Transcript_41388/m.54456 type:complete len:92 (+) Transcript_41388:83-358(+)